MDGDDSKANRFPPLQISDLLILTLCVGLSFVLGAPELRNAVTESGLAAATWQNVLPLLITHLALGTAFFGLIAVTRQRASGYEMQPGHWFFVAIGPYALLTLVTGAWREIFSVFWFSDTTVLFDAISDGVFMTAFFGSFVANMRGLRGQDYRWRAYSIFMLGWLFTGFAWCAVEISFGHDYPSEVLLVAWETTTQLASVAACVAIGIDLYRGVRRDWLHYCAIALLILLTVSSAMLGGSPALQWWVPMFYRLINL